MLVASALEKETGTKNNVEIIAMPDLGLSNNSMRMRGGFFTGMFMEWNADIPFVPVDATVNSCGVSIFSLRDGISIQEFISRINIAKSKIGQLGYNWNFERGNHFISLCQNDFGQYFIVMHASADEYKKSVPENSLYPVQDVWYYQDIKIVTLKNSGRYLRYLIGDPARKFILTAIRLERINKERMYSVANLIAGELIKEEVCYIPHYGMPTEASIAIGCSWRPEKSVLLTLPGKDIFIIESIEKVSERWLTPHGFGAEISDSSISYRNGELYINGIHILNDDDVASLSRKGIRHAKSDNIQIENHIHKILQKVNAKVLSILRPLVTIYNDGYAVYRE